MCESYMGAVRSLWAMIQNAQKVERDLIRAVTKLESREQSELCLYILQKYGSRKGVGISGVKNKKGLADKPAPV